MERIYRVNLNQISDERLQRLRGQYMDSPMSLLEVDEQDTRHLDDKLTSFMSGYLMGCNAEGFTLGMSGGLDSTLCAYLGDESVGADNMDGVLMPSSSVSSDKSILYALEVARDLGIRVNDYNIVRKYLDRNVARSLEMSEVTEDHPKWKTMRGNTFARERMEILRNRALKNNYLVLGTTNATEEWMGYASKGGDGLGGVDLEPILCLPKTSERMYARHKGLPAHIVDQAPSAELWQGQTDEGELSQWVGHPVTYESIDRVMVGVKLGLSNQDIVEANQDLKLQGYPMITAEVINRLKRINISMRHKSELPPSADLSG